MLTQNFRGNGMVYYGIPIICYYAYTMLSIILIILGLTFKIILISYSPYTNYVNTNIIIEVVLTAGCFNLLYNLIECVFRRRSLSLFCFIVFPVMILLQLIAVSYGFYQTADNNKFIYKDIRNSVKEYKTNIDTNIYFKQLEERMDCCGIDGPTDYLSISTDIPVSCCPPNAAIGSKCNLKNSFQTGCAAKVYNEIMWHIKILSAIILVFIALQIAILLFLCIKTRNYELGIKDEFVRILNIN